MLFFKPESWLEFALWCFAKHEGEKERYHKDKSIKPDLSNFFAFFVSKKGF